MRVAVVGYGNVGKALFGLVKQQNDMQLIGVFSRRRLTVAEYLPFDSIQNYRKQIDLLLVAQGSYGDVIENAQALCGFDSVDCFDNHAKIASYKSLLNNINGKNLSVVATGWDPGILSVVRALFDFDNKPVTLWGEGVSQGHSNAIRTIPEVIDAVQFTRPLKNATQLVDKGEKDATKLHERVCYVACVQSAKQKVERDIRTMPYYFDNYQTQVIFCTPQEVRKLKQKTQHCGKVISVDDGYSCQSTVEMQNNAHFTAKIMLRYAKILPKLKADGYIGAVDVLDIPLKYLSGNSVL